VVHLVTRLILIASRLCINLSTIQTIISITLSLLQGSSRTPIYLMCDSVGSLSPELVEAVFYVRTQLRNLVEKLDADDQIYVGL
jgi:hypothetical protein